jgi:tripartite-type tricarboxylate transporter receptor subunit TctC
VATAILLGLTLASCSTSSATASGSGKVDFAGKTVTLVVGTSPGGDYDILARTMQKYISKYLPGNPKISVINIEGGNHLEANTRVQSSKPDGLTVGFSSTHRWVVEATGHKESFDAQKAVYIGSPVALNFGILWCANRKKVTNPDVWQGILDSGHTVTAAATAPGGTVYLPPTALQLKGAPVKMVYGYSGGSEVDKAFASGESDTLARCDQPNTSKHPEDYSEKILAPIAWMGAAPTDEYLQTIGWDGPPPPEFFDLKGVTFTDAEKAAVDVIYQMQAMNHSLFLAPGTPQSIADAWVSALKDMTADPDFVAAMKAQTEDVKFAGPDEVRTVLTSLKTLAPDGMKFLSSLIPTDG